MLIKCTTRVPMLALALLLLLMPSAAQDNPAEPVVTRDQATLDAWAGLQKARAESEIIRAAVRGLIQKAETDEGKTAARRVLRESFRATGEMIDAATETFTAAFAQSDWQAWDVKQDADLLESGLANVARTSLKLDPKKAVATWETILEKLPDSNAAKRARTTWLPIALPSAGDLDHAEKRLRQLLSESDKIDKPAMHIAIGDTLALKGDFDGAQLEYAAATKDMPPDSELTKYDRRKRARRYANLRAAHIGKPAPEIDTQHWLGAKAQPLSALKGRVLILDYWATW